MTLALFPDLLPEGEPDYGDRDCWATPRQRVRQIALELGIEWTLDAAAYRWTAKAPRFYGPAEDGLAQPWEDVTWCNPPYSVNGSSYKGAAGIAAWAVKATEEGERGVRSALLTPSDLRSRDRQALAQSAASIPILTRIRFVPPAGVKPSSPNFGCHLHLFGPWQSWPRYLT